jgi:hypothetical protein
VSDPDNVVPVPIEELPVLWYVGDRVAGVVAECPCPEARVELGSGYVLVGRPHEGHQVVPAAFDDDLDWISFDRYRALCKLLAAAPVLLHEAAALMGAGALDDVPEVYRLAAVLNELRAYIDF